MVLFSFSCCLDSQQDCFLHSRIHWGRIPIYNIFSNKVQPPSNPAIIIANACTQKYNHTHLWATFTSGCHSVCWGMGKGEQRKQLSRLSITELSECYLCQTPTILSSDTETASRTSGRRGKHSRTPREVWQRHWIQHAYNTEHTCAHTHTEQYTHCCTMDIHAHKLTQCKGRHKYKHWHHLILQNCHAYTKQTLEIL